MDKLKLITLLILIFIPSNLHALIEVDITRGNLNPLPIAISPLHSHNETTKELKKKMKSPSRRMKL